MSVRENAHRAERDLVHVSELQIGDRMRPFWRMAARKNAPPPPSSDEVRRNLIRWFYALNQKGGAPRGMQDLCKGIKTEHGYKGPLVKEHLTFLCDLEYIRKESVRLLKLELARHEEIGSRAGKSAIVRWLIRTGRAEDSPLGEIPPQF
jgi:hypothetical protein